MIRAALLTLFVAALADDAKKEKPKVDPRFDEVVTLRRFIPGNKDKDGKPLEYLNPQENIPAFRQVVKDETRFHLTTPAIKFNPKSEVIDAAGNVWEATKVTDWQERRDAKGVWHAYVCIVTLKKKAPEPKK